MDNFSREIGKKLREHQLPVDSAVWDALEEQLPAPKGKKRFLWIWLPMGVAAVVLALVFLLNPFLEHISYPEHPLSLDQQTIPSSSVKEMVVDETEHNSQNELSHEYQSNNNRNPEIVEKLAKISSHTRRPDIEGRIESVQIKPLSYVSKQVEVINRIKLIPQGDGVWHSDTIGLPEQVIVAQNTPGEFAQSFIAAIGGGGLPIDFSLGGYGNDAPQSDIHSPGGDFNNVGVVPPLTGYEILELSDYTDVEHRLPVSFSLTADISIAKNVSLETGLSYTYLFSRFGRRDHSVYRGTLRQHYIGVPLNIRYHLWQNDIWTVYMQGGASIEKGLGLVYRQEIERDGTIVYRSRSHKGIQGFQFSAQGGVGFSYKLQDNLSLFGEPRIVYYFNNKQPISARTQNPFIFGLNLGIRLQFE